ncbi:MAG TPA: peptidylprolyl isomerase, partial [Isosphaeraceae bacterium]|nr:peptidylprolyl isomerase [Isosphaeraceae bacterium]
MLDRAWSGAFRREIRKSPRANCRPQLESLEGRRLLNASLATLPNISVPDYLGYQVPLDGSGSNAPTQTFTVMSSNTDIKANVAQGQFLTLNVSHQAANANDVTFNGPITVQLFQDLTPTTYQKLVGFITSGFYNGKTFFRVANNFPIGDTNGYIIQGGSS